MRKYLDFSKKHISAPGHTQFQSSETKKLKIGSTSGALGLIFWFLGVWGIHKSLGSHFLAKIENLCGNPILGAFLILWTKNFH